MLSAYGPGLLGRPPSYLEWVRLYLNLPRVSLRRAYATLLGVSAALTSANLGREWAEAQAETDAEAEELDFQFRKARLDARVKAKLHWG